MSAALLSGHWFRLAALKPRLRSHVRVQRHVYRGKVWYVIHDRVSGQHHRFNAAAHEVIRQLDGRQSMQQIWEQVSARLHDNSPTQTEIVQVLGQLNAADLLLIDATPDVAELIERRSQRQRKQWLGRVLNPMSLRLPLWDPEALLSALNAWVRPLPVSLAVLLWLAVVLPALMLTPAHWPELTRNFGERLLSADNLWVMAVAFPLLKAAHELAHGLAVKRGGGEVHEMGLMFLMFYPVPYVDASAAHAFAGKARRVWVGASGMAAEMFIAALAFYVWLAVEPGLLRSVAYNMVVLGSVTTLLFNANPLLRYDGYFILSDLIEMPNLGQRANRYWQYLVSRYAFGIAASRSEPATLAERRWLLFYAPAAFVYRLFITLSIAWFIAQHYFLFGVLFAVWSLFSGLLQPMFKSLKALFTQPQFVARAPRVWSTLAAVLGLAVLLLFVVPMPYHSRTQGVVWLPERALLRAASEGFVQRLLVPSGAQVQPGDAVLEAVNPTLGAQFAEQQAKVEEAQARLDAAWRNRPAEAGQQSELLAREQAALDRVQDELTRLVARPQVAGRLLIDRAQDLPGRYLKKGDLIGYVVGEQTPVVRVVVTQADVDRVRNGLRGVQVSLPGALGEPMAGRLVRAVPKAAHELPSAALGQGGGGLHAVDPRDSKQTTTIESLFEFELELPDPKAANHLGQRAYVSFEHPPEAIAWRWLRLARRQLLSRLEI